MKKKQTIEDLLNDPKMNERLKERLYSKKGLLGKESPFSEILQQMVNTIPELVEGLPPTSSLQTSQQFPLKICILSAQAYLCQPKWKQAIEILDF